MKPKKCPDCATVHENGACPKATVERELTVGGRRFTALVTRSAELVAGNVPGVATATGANEEAVLDALRTAIAEAATDEVIYPRHPFIADDEGGCAYCGGGEPEDERHSEPFERTQEECEADLAEATVAEHAFIANPDDPDACLSCNQGRDFGAHPAPAASDEPAPEPLVRPAPLTLAQALQRVSAREKAAGEANAALTIAKANAKGAEELLRSAMQALREAAEREIAPELPLEEVRS